MNKRKLIPFKFMPGSWGLKGKTREIAQAEYELDGTELLRKKIDININEYAYGEQKLAYLDLDHRIGKIQGQNYEKEKATILGEPWVAIKKLETDPNDPKYGGVELDWNQEFVDNLEKHGYGPNSKNEDTVNDWFNELCRNIALEAYAGIGDFEESVLGEDAEIRPSRRTTLHEDAIVMPMIINKPEEDNEDNDDNNK